MNLFIYKINILYVLMKLNANCIVADGKNEHIACCPAGTLHVIHLKPAMRWPVLLGDEWFYSSG
jgi:hypothetical protein